MTVTRVSFVTPGFDHVEEPCKPGGCGHGRHGDEWFYGIRDDDTAALVLKVFTPFLDGRRYGVLADRDPWGADLSLHVTYDVEGDVYSGSGDEGCDFLGRPCKFIAWTSALQASDFWKANATGHTFEQGDAFWLAFEQRLVEIRQVVEKTKRIAEDVIADRQKRDAWLTKAMDWPQEYVLVDNEPHVTVGDVRRWLRAALERKA